MKGVIGWVDFDKLFKYKENIFNSPPDPSIDNIIFVPNYRYKMKYLTLYLLFCTSFCQASTIEVNPDIQVTKLSDHTYLYTAWAEVGTWGRVGSNGLIVVDNGKAFLFDTPMHELQTIELVQWIKSNLNASLVGFVPGHWHSDCVGGLDYLNKQGVKTYANKMTNDILLSHGRPMAKTTFKDSTSLKLNNIEIKCYFLGGGHATDNIVMWIPSEKILFGGCMVKDCKTFNTGNTEDAAPLAEWAATVEKVKAKFPNAKIVIPGHGEIGGTELLVHTKQVLMKANK